MSLRWLCLVLLFVCGCGEASVPGDSSDESPEILPALLHEPSFVQEGTAGGDAGKERDPQLALLGVDQWHQAGYLGAGVKVAILDTGFDTFRDRLGHTLPQTVIVRSFRRDGDIKAGSCCYGVFCAEIVHALAPEAALLFANWEPDEPSTFLEAVRWASREGARIISCSVVVPAWGDGRGAGSVQDELSRLLRDDDLCRTGFLARLFGLHSQDGLGRPSYKPLFFASAGNVADRHWSGDFHPGLSGFHEWRPGKIDNTLSPWDAALVSVELTCPLGAEYRVSILDDDGNTVGVVHPVAVAGYRAVSVRFIPDKGSTYRLRLRQTAGKPGSVRVVVLGAALEWSISKGSIVFPGECPRVIAVGAVGGNGERLRYSACSSEAGKPELAAVVPFSGIDSFSGTSAAAPQAAGLAALIWGRFPLREGAEVRTELFHSCSDVGPPGVDAETGHGVIRLPRNDLMTR